MNLTCEYCGEPAMPSDSTCWHCGKPLPGREEKQGEVITAADSWRPSGKTNLVVAYSLITLIVIVAAIVVMALLGSQPLVQVGVGTLTPDEWKQVSPADDSFYVNLPETWQTFDGADVDQREALASRLNQDPYLVQGVHPFGAEVDDLTIHFLAQKEQSDNSTPGPFMVIGNSRVLAGLSYEEAARFLSESDYQVRETAVVDDFDKSNLSIYVRTPVDEESLGAIRCRQQFIRGEEDVMLAAVCAQDDLFRGQGDSILTILESFQRLSK